MIEKVSVQEDTAMRLRNIPGAREAMETSPYVIQDPTEEFKGHWHDFFENNNPIRIEIGMGKGNFITTLATENPDINYIGIEKYSSVLFKALEKRDPALKNLIFLRMEAENITDIFASGEVDRIYLNFSDPWPKDRHAKRRLTSPAFLECYSQFLVPGHTIEFKTDNPDLFAFSLESVEESGWKLLLVTDDLHHSPYTEGNVMTEYEKKFSEQGVPIHKMITSR